jgi:hypothetical protein
MGKKPSRDLNLAGVCLHDYEVASHTVQTIDLSIDYSARTARVNVPGLVEGQAQSIRNPVTGAPHPVKVTMPTGFEFTESEVLSGKSKASGPIELDLDGSHAHLARIHWTTHGVVR